MLDLLASIDGFADPFSTYLRAEVSEDGSILGDYYAQTGDQSRR